MRPLVAGAVLAALISSGVPAQAAETGTIEGVVQNETAERPQEGVEVTLTSGTRGDNELETQTVTTDERGRYRFEDLPTGPERFYFVDAIFDDGLFSGGAVTIPSDTDEDPVIDTTLKVWSTTTEPDAILIARDSLFLSTEGATLAVVESIRIANLSQEAYIGRGGGRSEGSTSVGFTLPEGADPATVAIVDSDLNIPELIPTDFGFGATIAIPPGETDVTFSYTVRGTAAAYDLSRRALYPTVRMNVYASDPLDVRSNRLTDEGEVEIGDRKYQEHTTRDGLDAGDSLQLVAIADAGAPRGLILGMVGALALVLLLGALPLIRRRRYADAEEPEETLLDGREALLKEIAELDLERENGEVDEDEWATRRASLKARLLGETEEKV